MTTMVSARDPTISQPLEGIPLNQFAATLEHIRIRLARFEARLDERDCWAAAVRPPAQPPPEPDPPYGIPYYTSWNFGAPTTEANNSIGHQPYTTFDAAAQPQPYLQNSNYVGPSSTTYQQPYHTMLGQPTCQDQPILGQPLGLQQYDQPPAHRVSCWEPSLTATVVANKNHQHYQHPRSDCPLQQASPARPVIAPLLASLPRPQAAVPCLRTNEWETNQHEGEERMEIQGLVDKHKEAFETTKQDMEVEIDGKRLLFDDELQLNIEVVAKGGVSLYAFIGDEGACSIRKGLKEFPFSYSDWHASDVVSMNHRSTSLDADTRLIPPRNDTLYLGIRGRVDKIPVLVLEYHDPKGPPLVSFDVNEEGRCSTSRCVFDPGGNGSSSKLLFTMLFVDSWFPP